MAEGDHQPPNETRSRRMAGRYRRSVFPVSPMHRHSIVQRKLRLFPGCLDSIRIRIGIPVFFLWHLPNNPGVFSFCRICLPFTHSPARVRKVTHETPDTVSITLDVPSDLARNLRLQGRSVPDPGCPGKKGTDPSGPIRSAGRPSNRNGPSPSRSKPGARPLPG